MGPALSIVIYNVAHASKQAGVAACLFQVGLLMQLAQHLWHSRGPLLADSGQCTVGQEASRESSQELCALRCVKLQETVTTHCIGKLDPYARLHLEGGNSLLAMSMRNGVLKRGLTHKITKPLKGSTFGVGDFQM